VYKIQKRIYKASQHDDVKTVRRLQKTLIKSWSAKCLAVRRLTQDNQAKKTAGVDGVKSLSPEASLALVNELKLGNKSKPTRRVRSHISLTGKHGHTESLNDSGQINLCLVG
jgi:RNA-directed DNA polymerase